LSSTIAEIKAQVKLLFESVSDIGNVYDRGRYVVDRSKFKEVASVEISTLKKTQIRILTFRPLVRVYEEKDSLQGWQLRRDWKAQYVFGFSDELNSTALFDTMIDTICTTFNAKKTLKSTVTRKTLLNMTSSGEGNFGGSTVHEALFEFKTYEYIGKAFS